MRKIYRKIEIATNEDGDVYGAVAPHRKLTKIGALRAINKELEGWGINEDIKITIDDLNPCEFWETTGGEYDGWIWWGYPKNGEKFIKIESLGVGWIYKVY